MTILLRTDNVDRAALDVLAERWRLSMERTTEQSRAEIAHVRGMVEELPYAEAREQMVGLAAAMIQVIGELDAAPSS
jgi:hypothetical protein